MIDEERVLEFIQDEINFFTDYPGPWRYRFLCWLLRIRPRRETIIEELEFVILYIEAMTHPPKIHGQTTTGEWSAILSCDRAALEDIDVYLSDSPARFGLGD